MSFSVPGQPVVLHNVERTAVNRRHHVDLANRLLVSKRQHECVKHEEWDTSQLECTSVVYGRWKHCTPESSFCEMLLFTTEIVLTTFAHWEHHLLIMDMCYRRRQTLLSGLYNGAMASCGDSAAAALVKLTDYLYTLSRANGTEVCTDCKSCDLY